ncbi:hypothetical protein LZ31DRAFT_169627 [Colletotrichum somersetense]|nr:hypothetical protein LZ31DRAFT_169627 [Colletotrichum somersetense]
MESNGYPCVVVSTSFVTSHALSLHLFVVFCTLFQSISVVLRGAILPSLPMPPIAR